jgi:uncharacterized protein (DUF1697 family)
MPRSEARNPARDVGREGFVFGAESLAQRRLLVADYEQVRDQPREQGELQNANVAEQQGLAENRCDDRDVHGIAHVTIAALDHQVPCRKDGRRRPQPLQRETRERIEHHKCASGNQHRAADPQWRVGWKRCAELPARNPPGHESGDAARGEHEKQPSSQQRESAPAAIICLRLTFSGHFLCRPSVAHFNSSAQITYGGLAGESCVPGVARPEPRVKSCDILRGTMSVIISMLRGVNVGGHNKIKMDELRAVYESLGFRDAQTYIQSGNVVCRADGRDLAAVCKRIEKGIERNFGFRPGVIVRTAPELREVMVRNPFAKRSGIDASRLLVAFLASSPAADALDKVLKIKCQPQELRVSGRELFIYFPNGMARPTLSMATVERTLKISSTGRNWNTVRKLLEMAEALEAAG